MKDFNITFFGVSGSSATSSKKRVKYGNNTSCALVKAGDHLIILDMGSGLVQLSHALVEDGVHDADILLSHFHYDHIEGFPFFDPFFNGGRFTIHAEPRQNYNNPTEILGVEQLFFAYMKPPFFPITPTVLQEHLNYHNLKEDESFMLGEDVQIETMHINHPDFATAYKISYDGRCIVHLLDYEHPAGADTPSNLIAFCKDADLAVYDCAFTKEEYDSGRYVGWGHSTYEQAIEFAKQATIKAVVMTHHAIWRTDDELDAIEAKFSGLSPVAIMAKEKRVVTI